MSRRGNDSTFYSAVLGPDQVNTPKDWLFGVVDRNGGYESGGEIVNAAGNYQQSGTNAFSDHG